MLLLPKRERRITKQRRITNKQSELPTTGTKNELQNHASRHDREMQVLTEIIENAGSKQKAIC